MTTNWFYWAILSAVFAALTAIFAKIGIEKVDSDLATLIRTFVIGLVLAIFIYTTGKWSNPFTLSSRTLLFLILSALATGASWVCYFRALKMGQAANVAAIDKFSVVLVAIFAFVFLHERLLLREWLAVLMIGGGVVLLATKK